MPPDDYNTFEPDNDDIDRANRRLLITRGAAFGLMLVTAAIVWLFIQDNENDKRDAAALARQADADRYSLAQRVAAECADETQAVKLGAVCRNAAQIVREGPPGPAGPPGERGPRGFGGLSAYEVAVTTGAFNGGVQEWLESLRGPRGFTGITGVSGKTGPKGDKGDTGEKGDTGDTGPAGADGTNGTDGAPGPQGEKGDKGETGDKGEPGAPGKEITAVSCAGQGPLENTTFTFTFSDGSEVTVTCS